MATVRTSCPDCGDVELTTKDLMVRSVESDGSGVYSYKCPECRVTIIKSAERRTIDLLMASGVEQGVVLTQADLRRFVNDLRKNGKFEDAFAKLVRETR
ncbi:MAG TPA: hypothetical protein PJ993_00275 [Candidatus Saccharibacteria bacterium]|nr:hypothetical protein [Candidatus Saccharibacteria bacterium]HMT39361.1 hypothetical protein [Candidatus Saccharibacteria bacterium]